MLIQFNFENFKSFYSEMSLDMTATSIKEHEYNLMPGINNTETYLKVAAIYGANASGKSNVIEAFMFMQYFVHDSFRDASKRDTISVKPFIFTNAEEAKPSMFEVFFQYNGKEYQYGFVVSRHRIIEEWLYKRDFRSKHKYKPLFVRDETGIDASKLKGASNFVSMVENNTLFLSIIANAKISDAKEVYDWFTNNIIMDFGDISFEHFLTGSVSEKIESEQFRNELVYFLNAIDIPIVGIEVDKDENNEETSYRIYSQYKVNGRLKSLNFKEESSGTQKMLSIFMYLKQLLQEASTLWVDELDAKLHPLLLRYIVTTFHDEEANPHGAQLIYTTHDHYTLTKELFRRDQVWFVEKNERLQSELYSLAEYRLENNQKVRNDATYNKDYLLGRYGAVPVLKGFDMWGNQYGKE